MKKIALITTNKILAQSLDLAIEARPDLGIEFYLLLNSNQALLDAEILEIDIALIDLVACAIEEKEAVLSLWEKLNKKLPECHLLLLVSQEDWRGREIANEAKSKGIIEDFVFYDASLKYLFAKLAAF